MKNPARSTIAGVSLRCEARKPSRPSVLITAGPTREYLDSVRFISNASSGTMGAELSAAFLRKKSPVAVVAGPCPERFPRKAAITRVVSAAQMMGAVKKLVRRRDIFVAAAAVADYTIAKRASGKIKKRSRGLTLKLKPSTDILKAVGEMKFPRGKRPVIIGFALESRRRLIADARRKLKTKKCDAVVANALGAMESPMSGGAIIFADGRVAVFNNISKRKLAGRLANEAVKLWSERNS
ncbi:MAG: phosphopantothenoylcysteine decarboxylase [Endomicrobiia bacterium]|nr:phosphopantothenoylcysteine decarboxylase [Endomicrobiia bacterium]